MHNGKQIKQIYGDYSIIKVEQTGVYRVEAYHKHGKTWRPWIYSNSIWLV